MTKVSWLTPEIALRPIAVSEQHLDGNQPYTTPHSDAAAFMEFIAWPACILFTVLGWFKYGLSKKLGSEVLQKDALCSLLAAFLSFIVIIAGALEESKVEGAWKMDPVTAILIAIIFFVEGSRTVIGNVDAVEDLRAWMAG